MSYIKKIFNYTKEYPSTEYSFKARYPYIKRLEEAENNLKKYKNEKIPVIIETDGNLELGRIKNNKYIIPKELTVGHMMVILKEKILEIDEKNSILIYVGSSKILEIPKSSETIERLYEKYQDEDKFLYLKISILETYG